MATCRLCDKPQESERLIKYGVRHYAHPSCALTRWGAAFFDRLSLHELENFPALMAEHFKVFPELLRATEAKYKQLGYELPTWLRRSLKRLEA
jgi:hypothetical protein